MTEHSLRRCKAKKLFKCCIFVAKVLGICVEKEFKIHSFEAIFVLGYSYIEAISKGTIAKLLALQLQGYGMRVLTVRNSIVENDCWSQTVVILSFWWKKLAFSGKKKRQTPLCDYQATLRP